MPISPETMKSMHQVMAKAVSALSDMCNTTAINAALLEGLNEPEYANTFKTVHALLATSVRKLAMALPDNDESNTLTLDSVALMVGDTIITLGLETAQTYADSMCNPKLVKEKVPGDMREELEVQYRKYVDFVLSWKSDTDALYEKSIKAMEKHNGKD